MTCNCKGGRNIGMDISEGSVGFTAAMQAAKSVGVGATELPQTWDQIEPSRGSYQANFATIADQYYPTVGIKIELGISPIDSNNLRMPSYLAGKALNDPAVIGAYKALVDYEASLIHAQNVITITVGNEVDSYLGSSNILWQQYTDFFSQVAPYIRAKFPNAVVGVKMTYQGLTSKYVSAAQKLNKYADAVLVTYYPFLPGTWMVADPSVVRQDFGRIAGIYPDKNIYFSEIGYPSGAGNGSSESMQSDFVHQSFVAWDMYAAKIPLLNFVWLHDKSQDDVAAFVQYYGITDSGFASYLATLGLRTYAGTAKESFITLRSEAIARGW